VGQNIRIILINNGVGVEFRNYNHHAASFGSACDEYIAAAGHFGKKSSTLVRQFAENLGFEYLTASTKDEFANVYEKFVSEKIGDAPIILEVFTDAESESAALRELRNIEQSVSSRAKTLAKEIIGNDRLKAIKRLIKT
jgi:2-succinyl-5-enolpyruvyl-6-hydroxy-3-cyclohexene-1-carboxylate synthase